MNGCLPGSIPRGDGTGGGQWRGGKEPTWCGGLGMDIGGGERIDGVPLVIGPPRECEVGDA